MVVFLHSFLNEVCVQGQPRSLFTPPGKNPGTHEQETVWGFVTDLDMLKTRKIFCLCWDSKNVSSSPQPSLYLFSFSERQKTMNIFYSFISCDMFRPTISVIMRLFHSYTDGSIFCNCKKKTDCDVIIGRQMSQ